MWTSTTETTTTMKANRESELNFYHLATVLTRHGANEHTKYHSRLISYRKYTQLLCVTLTIATTTTTTHNFCFPPSSYYYCLLLYSMTCYLLVQVAPASHLVRWSEQGEHLMWCNTRNFKLVIQLCLKCINKWKFSKLTRCGHVDTLRRSETTILRKNSLKKLNFDKVDGILLQ